MKTKLKILVCMVCIVAMMIPMNGSMAYLVHNPGAADTTTLQGAVVSAEVVQFENHVLPNQLSVKNTGNVTCWVRVIMDVNWVNVEDNNWHANGNWETDGRLILGDPPHGSAGTYPNGMPYTADYTMTEYSDHWLRGSEPMVYYYMYRIGAGGTAARIINAFTVHRRTRDESIQGVNRTFTLTVDVQVDAIQAEEPSRFAGGKRAVEEAWGVTLNAEGTQIIAVP